MRWISWVNLALFGAIALVGFGAYLLSSHNEPSRAYVPPKKESGSLPKNVFAQSKEAYQALGNGPLTLKYVPPQLLLPDLRQEIVFSGKNGRPDVKEGKAATHISFKGSGTSKSVPCGERIYLVYEGSLKQKGSYSFSPWNQETSLWIECSPAPAGMLRVQVGMQSDQGESIASPAELREFVLPLAEQHRVPPTGWDLGGYKVDTTLLVRQRARWIGNDLFLEMHGGDEFAQVSGRQRIDFLEGETPYSCFVREGDFLYWNEGRWEVAAEQGDTEGLPLLVVKRVDEKVMQFDLWDSEGRNKLTLSLLHAREHTPFPDVSDQFKFVGSKTWAQFIVECQAERMILRPHDWLVLHEGKWQRLTSPEEVDNYVNNRLTGPLFILDKMTKQNGRNVLLGHLFNANRTEVREVELPATQQMLMPHYSNMSLPPPLRAEHLHPFEELE